MPNKNNTKIIIYHTRYLRPLKDYLVASLETVLPVAARAPAVYNGVTQFTPVKSLLKNVAGFVDGPTISKKQLRHSDIKIADIETVKALPAEELENTVVIVQDAFTSYFETPLILDLVNALRLALTRCLRLTAPTVSRCMCMAF
jgi:hypothetical protein